MFTLCAPCGGVAARTSSSRLVVPVFTMPPVDVAFDGALGRGQSRGNGPAGQSVADQHDDLAFAISQRYRLAGLTKRGCWPRCIVVPASRRVSSSLTPIRASLSGDTRAQHARPHRRDPQQVRQPRVFVGVDRDEQLHDHRVCLQRAISMKSGLRSPAVCGCSGSVSGGWNCRDF